MVPEIDNLIAWLQSEKQCGSKVPTPFEQEVVVYEEGLDLLAAFRRIPDAELRNLLRNVVEAFAPSPPTSEQFSFQT